MGSLIGGRIHTATPAGMKNHMTALRGGRLLRTFFREMSSAVVIRIVHSKSNCQELANRLAPHVLWIMRNLHLLIKLVGNYINNNWQLLWMKLITHSLY